MLYVRYEVFGDTRWRQRRRSGRAFHALAIYLKGFQVLSDERLRGLFHDAFGLDVSEGALMNMFIRSRSRLAVQKRGGDGQGDFARRLRGRQRWSRRDRRSRGVRIEGTNSFHWVFHCKDAVVHQPD